MRVLARIVQSCQHRLGSVALTGLLLVLLLGGTASASSISIVGVNQTYAGKTYGQWSATWWQWAASFSGSTSPLSDTTGARCGFGQRGAVWFLAGVAGITGQPASNPFATRDCTVPADKALLIPVINSECSSIFADCGTTSTDYDTLLALTDEALPGANGTVTVDGQVLSSPIRTASPKPPFPIFVGGTATDPSPLCPQCSGLSGVSVADGLWYLLRPLSPGQHTVVIVGNLPAFGFSVDVTYHLTVTENQQ